MAKENKIIIISTMRGTPWGGSEELWYRMLKCGLTEYKQFFVSVFNNGALSLQIKELQQLSDIEVRVLNDRVCLLPTLPVRLMYRLLRKPVKSTYISRFADLDQHDAGIVLLSLGDLQEILYHEDLFDFLKKTSKKLVVLVQHVAEFGFINEENKQRMLLILKKASAVLFVAERNKISTERRLVHTFSNARVIRNPLNLKNTNYIPYPASDVLRIAVVSRLHVEVKGQDILLQVLANEKWRSRKIEVHLFGTGAHADYLEKLIDYYQLEDRVRLMGHVADICSIWEKHQLLLLCSRSEGTPLSLVEAMVCGRAALVTDVGDCAGLITEGLTGFIAEAATEKCLDAALERAWESRNRLETMGRSARLETIKYREYPTEQELLDYLNTL